MPRAEGYLFGFGKKVVRIAVEHHLAQRRYRHQFLRDDLGWIEQVEIEPVLVLLRDDLHAEFPLRVVTHLDGFPQVAAMVIGILTRKLLGFIPQQ
ncbi:hypothetical protein D3C86_1810760 [compost metagenome]